MKKVDVIIPTYKPDKRFIELVRKLKRQTYPIHKIVIMNTEEKYYNQLIYGTNFSEESKNVEVYHLSKKEFDHGKTRNQGVKRTDADYFVCLTQDAMLVDNSLIGHLVEAIEQPAVAVAYGRQLPDKDCDVIEQYTRAFNYPEHSFTKGIEELPRLGIKTYFCSNVCAIYKRDIFEKLGGFISHTIFNEDMIYAAGVVKEGYRIAYAANACVIHSHNYTCMEQFHRNFDLGVSQADNPGIFANIPSESEGIQMVQKTAEYLRKNGMRNKVFLLYIRSGFKYIGYRMGYHYKKLPRKLVLKCTMNKDYWHFYQLKNAATGIDASKGYGRTEAEMKK